MDPREIEPLAFSRRDNVLELAKKLANQRIELRQLLAGSGIAMR